MKTIPPVIFALMLQGATVSATEQIVTLGDSLSFAYEAEFCFTKTVTGVGTIGDNMPQTTRNWIEILSNPIYRGDRFELGARDSVYVTPPADPPFDLYFRQSYNWSIPGLKVHDLRQFLAGQATITSIMGADSDFSTLSTILTFSDFNNATDFALPDLESQIQGTAERVTVMVGGNDIRAAYGAIYNGGSGVTFINDFMTDLVAVLDRLHTLNPNIQIVVANVPHVGITPLVRASWPYDVVKTERVSAVLRDLNGRIAAEVATRQLGLADLYSATLQMLDGTKLCIHGNTFLITGSVLGNLDNVWLNGPTSKNFHPNTSGQAVIANEVIHAFNIRYQTGIPQLSATEMLGGLLEKTPSQIDLPYLNWINRYIPAPPSPATTPASDDSDGDGIPAGLEFALGLNPIRRDSDYLSSGIVNNQLELAYPRRLPSSSRFTLTPESSATLATPFTPLGVAPVIGLDGLYRARMPVGSSPGFLRLKVLLP